MPDALFILHRVASDLASLRDRAEELATGLADVEPRREDSLLNADLDCGRHRHGAPALVNLGVPVSKTGLDCWPKPNIAGHQGNLTIEPGRV